MRTLAIGDVHGCCVSLIALLDYVKLKPDDQLIFMGDYIDRGPASREVVERLVEMQRKCETTFLRGNHEIIFLEAREDPLKSHLWQSYGGLETAFSYGADFRDDWPAAIPTSDWAFFERTAKYFETSDHIFVHACLKPEIDMAAQSDWFLYWENFEKLQPHKSGKRIICGHTSQKSGRIKDAGFAVCIDTNPSAGGWLTCLDVGCGEFWQANEKGDVRGSVIGLV